MIESSKKNQLHMKRILLLCLMTVLLGVGTASAQSILFGPGVSYRMADEVEGVHFRTYFALPKWLSFGPEFTYFLPASFEGVVDSTLDYRVSERRLWSADFNFHIDIKVKNVLTLYPIIGGNLTKLYEVDAVRSETGQLSQDPIDDLFFGLNVGGGLHLVPKQMGPFFEYKATLGDLKQQVFTAGFLFRINLKGDDFEWVDRHEDPRTK